jgi:hypothetical protein
MRVIDKIQVPQRKRVYYLTGNNKYILPSIMLCTIEFGKIFSLNVSTLESTFTAIF